MNQLNLGRVIGGGLLAGLIINIAEGVINGAILGQEWKQWQASMGPLNHAPSPGAAMGVWTFIAFAIGILGVWLYAAIRPRYGAGVKTAIRAGLAIWILYWPLVQLQHFALGTVPSKILTPGTIGGALGALLGIVAGAAIYKEKEIGIEDARSYAKAVGNPR